MNPTDMVKMRNDMEDFASRLLRMEQHVTSDAAAITAMTDGLLPCTNAATPPSVTELTALPPPYKLLPVMAATVPYCPEDGYTAKTEPDAT